MPNTNPSPKQRFLDSTGNISLHRDMIASKTFDLGTDAALLQYQAMVGQTITDGNSAMAAGFKLQGAMEYLMTLKLLSEKPQAPAPRIVDNLDHKA